MGTKETRSRNREGVEKEMSHRPKKNGKKTEQSLGEKAHGQIDWQSIGHKKVRQENKPDEQHKESDREVEKAIEVGGVWFVIVI